jgi:hypothetical protein
MKEYLILDHPKGDQKVIVSMDDITDIEPYQRFDQTGKAWVWQSIIHIRNVSRAVEVRQTVEEVGVLMVANVKAELVKK